MEKDLVYNEENNTLYINKEFLNSTWFLNFGIIQKKLLSMYDKKIRINMQDCLFISPTPFLSLLLTLRKIKQENNCTLEIELPQDDSLKKRKFLNYCSKEGFLDIINFLSEKKYEVSKYNSYNVIGNENFEYIYKARIFELEQNENKVENIVSGIIDEINQNNLNINKAQRLYIIVTIRNILHELIDNVDKHAYEKERKYFSIYIRVRNSTDSTIRIGKINNTYGRLQATTKPDEIYVHKGIEVYFQDIGKGIIKSYEEKGVSYPNRPLKEIIKDAFFKEKFENRENNTPVNGLAFLRKIIEEKNNFFCVYNGEEGVGNFGINDTKINVNNIHMRDIGNSETIARIKGQIYNFTLFDREYSKFEKECNKSLGKLLSFYTLPFRDIKMEVIDLRDDLIKYSLEALKSEVILFVPDYLTKNLIINILKQVLINSAGVRRLIISDIEDEELVLFEFALKNLYVSRIEDKGYLSELYIVTKTLKIIGFKLDSAGLKLSQVPVSFFEFNNKYNYLFKIKIYESKYLAKVLENNFVGRFILTKGIVEWSNNDIIDGFINFDMMTADDVCFDLLCRNLKRILPLIGLKRLYAIDSVVERVVGAVNLFTDEDIDERFGVGSIVVSGLTLQSSDYIGNTIHFFSRGKNNRKPALFFDPIYLYKSDENPKEYIRIGKTSRIKLKNSKKVSRNTNSYLEEKETYKILHQYAYSSVLCGHLCFEERHDLLSINLNAIMYDKNTELYNFVEKIIKFGIGHYFNESLQEDGSNFFDILKGSCMIVYPYNQLSSSILKMCKIVKKYRKYIIGLSPTNITRQGENLEYSECFTEYIRQIIEEYIKTNNNHPLKVIIFDTLSYSGKTKQEIYEYINSIEEIEPYYVTIIDAKVNHYTKQINCLNYMNLNIPLLGNSETCIICLVLNKLSVFKDSVIDANILSSIKNIEEIWRVRDIRNYKEIIKLPNFERIYAKKILTYDTKMDCQEDELYFVNALPLYIFITNRIKLENDYAPFEFILENYKSNIGSDSMAYIIALFILEYGESVYHSLLSKSMRVLLDYLKDSNELFIRQFVVLALLSVTDERLSNIVFDFINQDKGSMQMRYEGQIVLMYCLKRKTINKSDAKIMFLYNKMKSGNNRLDLYKQFHCQLKNTNGNVHNSPLRSLINRQVNIENTRLALASLSLLEESLKCAELAFDILYEEGRDNKQENTNIEISTIRETCLVDIKEVKTNISKRNNTEYIIGKFGEIFKACEEMHKRLFAPYIIKNDPENRNLKSIVTCLIERIDVYNEKIRNDDSIFPLLFDESYESKVEVSSNIVTIYYIWNNMLVREIDYILDNVGKFVKEPETVKIDNQKVSGQIKIEITASEFTISIYNNTRESIEDIKKKSKQRYQKEVLSLLGVKFDYCKNEKENSVFEQEAVITKIIIPNIQNIRER